MRCVSGLSGNFKEEVAVKRQKYVKPVIVKMDKMTFPIDIIEARGGIVCKQCSSCHGCR